MKLAIDVNRYVDLARNVSEVVRIIERADEVYVPFSVLAELRAGFRAGQHQHPNEAALTRFLQKPGVFQLFPDEYTTHVYGELYMQLRQAGKPIPTNDLWIAALVVQHGLVLFSRDKHFDMIPQIARI